MLIKIFFHGKIPSKASLGKMNVEEIDHRNVDDDMELRPHSVMFGYQWRRLA